MKLDHIGIAVANLEESMKFYGQVLGLDISAPEDLPDRQLRICMVDLGVGDANVELLWPTHPDSAVAKFIEKKGPGIHHLCYRVDDLAAEIKKLAAAGVKMIDSQPRPGAHNTLVAFVHPRSAGGVLTELAQKRS
ncbi:MAG TPA: methylmalonyl-CoA epimerase [Myxococcota bacterium]|nr:methylmalonyl-CoA epimerase [Myxococcota bacterium]